MPRRGQKMSPEQRRKIAEAVKDRNAKRKASIEAGEPIVEQVAGAEVEVASPVGVPTPSLLDRIKSGLKGASNGASNRAESEKEGVDSENLLYMALPAASGFLAFHARSLWVPEYQECAPLKAEVAAILKPLLRIVSRSLDISFKETPLIRDLRLSATALLSYVVRAAMTHIEISEKLDRERAVQSAERHIQTNARRRDARPDNQGPNNSASANGGGTGNVQGGGGGRIHSEPIAPPGNAPETDAEYARRIIREAYQQDRQYRNEHGML